jgi:hypothetical protein
LGGGHQFWGGGISVSDQNIDPWKEERDGQGKKCCRKEVDIFYHLQQRAEGLKSSPYQNTGFYMNHEAHYL